MTLTEWASKYPEIAAVATAPYPEAPAVRLITSRALAVADVPTRALHELRAVTDYKVTGETLQAAYSPTVWIAPRRDDRDDWTRTEYMNREIDHETYYASLARAMGWAALRAIVLRVAPLDTIVVYREDLNKIPLAHWDACHAAVRGLVTHKLMDRSWCGSPLSPGMICWSLSESVCVLKAVARVMAEQVIALGAAVDAGDKA